MVSLSQRQDLAALSAADPHLKQIELLLNGEQLPASGSNPGDVREALLLAISANDSARFKISASEIGQRKISAASDWCNDDYLLFLLILGNQKFGKPLSFLSAVIEARRTNTNPLPQKINEVFGALDRGEFNIEGEFGFLKIPFLRLIGKLRIGSEDARKALDAMSKPGLFDQMSPFLKLLSQKAYDLVLTDRQPAETETTVQLLEAFEAHAKNFSLRDWRRVVTALPVRVLLALVTFLIGLGVLTVLFGAGKALVESHSSGKSLKRPTEIGIASIRAPDSELPPEAFRIASEMSRQVLSSSNKLLTVEIDSTPLTAATPSFTVEASHPNKEIRNAFVFSEEGTDGARPITVLPLQRDQGRVRAIVPEEKVGERLCFILQFEAGTNDTVQSIGKAVTLRPLQ